VTSLKTENSYHHNNNNKKKNPIPPSKPTKLLRKKKRRSFQIMMIPVPVGIVISALATIKIEVWQEWSLAVAPFLPYIISIVLIVKSCNVDVRTMFGMGTTSDVTGELGSVVESELESLKFEEEVEF
jgi:hypothetical protein